MDKNKPETIWTTKQSPSRDPKFHHIDKFNGAGKSTKALLAIFARGWDLRKGIDIFNCKVGEEKKKMSRVLLRLQEQKIVLKQ